MNFTPTPLAGAYVVEPELRRDERGFFARTWCEEEFRDHGLAGRLAQCSVSFNTRKGTLRGMHYQKAPHQEAKLIRCTRGSIHDVIVDLRQDSRTFGEHFSTVLSAENHRMMYAPEGFAHGYLTLESGSEIFYQMSAAYLADAACGFRWNDPTFRIVWPDGVSVISERDRTYPDFLTP